MQACFLPRLSGSVCLLIHHIPCQAPLYQCRFQELLLLFRSGNTPSIKPLIVPRIAVSGVRRSWEFPAIISVLAFSYFRFFSCSVKIASCISLNAEHTFSNISIYRKSILSRHISCDITRVFYVFSCSNNIPSYILVPGDG